MSWRKVWGMKCFEQGEGWQTLSTITCEALLRTECGSTGILLTSRNSYPRASAGYQPSILMKPVSSPQAESLSGAPVSLHSSLALSPMDNAMLNCRRLGSQRGLSPQPWRGLCDTCPILCTASSFLGGSASRSLELRGAGWFIKKIECKNQRERRNLRI